MTNIGIRLTLIGKDGRTEHLLLASVFVSHKIEILVDGEAIAAYDDRALNMCKRLCNEDAP